MSIKVKNGSKRLIQEIWDLKAQNRPLFNLLMVLRGYCKAEFNKDITITMIYRNNKEQDRLYKDNERYKKKKFKSPHQFMHALDLRSTSFEQEEIEQIEDYLNNKYNDSNYYRWTARDHTVGHGTHFHIQYLEDK